MEKIGPFFSPGYIVKLIKWHPDRTKEIACIDSSARGMISRAERQPVASLFLFFLNPQLVIEQKILNMMNRLENLTTLCKELRTQT